MNRKQLYKQIRRKESVLCVGLDTDVSKIPSIEIIKKHSMEPVETTADWMFTFNKVIIEMTREFAIAYKPNFWFYYEQGAQGLEALRRTIDYLKLEFPEMFVIIDYKGGDIGNTSAMAARGSFTPGTFDNQPILPADAVTINPYMGEDVVKKYYEHDDAWAVILALTSNDGAKDFQKMRLDNGIYLYEEVLFKASRWGTPDNTMFVIGATNPEELKSIRKEYPDHFFLVPGIGAQGGSLEAVLENGLNDKGGLLINNARKIIYASNDEDFGRAAYEAAKENQRAMAEILKMNVLI